MRERVRAENTSFSPLSLSLPGWWGEAAALSVPGLVFPPRLIDLCYLAQLSTAGYQLRVTFRS